MKLGSRIAVVLALLAGGCLGGGCRSRDDNPGAQADGPPAAWFEAAGPELGLDFIHDPGSLRGYDLPQIIGSGAALFDFDNDGRLDVYLVQNAGPGSNSKNRLYRQGPDGRFTDVSAGSGLDVAGRGMGVAVGDVNNDGWRDVLLTEYGRLRLLLNSGTGTFIDVTGAAELDNPLWGTSAAFFDYDRDGWLDLVVVNYVDYDPSWKCTIGGTKPDYCHPKQFPGTVVRLFRNRGAAPGTSAGRVRFEDCTLKSGLASLPGPGLGVVGVDFTGDRWPDILVANDAKENRLWINQRDGTFRNEAVSRGLAYNGLGQTQGNMGIALGDADLDGAFDVFITHLTEETNTLWFQGPTGVFRDRTAAAGLASPGWRGTGWGTALADFDHDGAPDIALVNGRVSRARTPTDPARLGPHWSEYAERNQLFANDGRGRFRDRSPEEPALCGLAGVYRGLACGDVDGDGALDLLVTQIAGPARLYRNVVRRRGHWLMVRAIDPALRREAYGAEVTVRVGARLWKGWINPAYGYLCSNDPRAHFGLGAAEHVDAVEVVWPDGRAEVFPGTAVDREVVLRKGEGKQTANESLRRRRPPTDRQALRG